MKNRNRSWFVVKFFAILLAAVLILICLNTVYINGHYYTDTYGEVQKFKNVPYGITLANTGTSHGLASFHYPEELGEVSFNFALSGEDIYHDFQTIKQFSDHIAKNCIIAIPTSYFSFCMSLDEPSQKRHYSYLDKEFLRGFSYETLINAKYLPVLRSGEYLFKDFINDQSIDLNDMMQEEDITSKNNTSAATSDDQAARQAQNESLRSHAKGRAQGWRSSFLVYGDQFIEGNLQLLTDMVNYCKAQGWKPLLVTTPVHFTLNEAFSQEELETYYFSNVREVAEVTGVPYWDMSHDKTFSNEPSYYSNSDHMNETGRAAFLPIYLKYLHDIGYR